MKSFLVTVSLLAFSATTHAGYIDFQSMANSGGSLGESAFSNSNPFTYDIGSGIDLTLKAYSNTSNGLSDAFVYFDADNAGVGVCKSVGGSSIQTDSNGKMYRGGYTDGTNLCALSSDDNVTGTSDFTEWLSVSFSADTYLESLVFNNNHDQPYGFDQDDLIDIFGTQTSVDNGNTRSGVSVNGGWNLTANTEYFIKYVNEQFYLEGATASAVPEPSILALLAAGFAGLGFTRKRKALKA